MTSPDSVGGSAASSTLVRRQNNPIDLASAVFIGLRMCASALAGILRDTDQRRELSLDLGELKSHDRATKEKWVSEKCAKRADGKRSRKLGERHEGI